MELQSNPWEHTRPSVLHDDNDLVMKAETGQLKSQGHKHFHTICY